MKIRIGYVSNSSSSSFICSRNDYPTIYDLANAMLDIRDADWESYHNKENDIRKERERTNLKKLQVQNEVPIAFSSCNYDTFIFPVENYYFVSTCNNHNFFDTIEFIEYTEEDVEYNQNYLEITKPHIDFVVFRENCNDIQESLRESNYYYWPEFDKFLKCAYGEGNCKHGVTYDLYRIADKNGIYCHECLGELND